MEIIGSILCLTGGLFLFLGGLGVLRMPDSYNRIHAGTKATTLGAGLFMLGISCYHPEWFFKLMLLMIFVFFTNPISSHALARAAINSNVPLTGKTVVNKLADEEIEEEDEN